MGRLADKLAKASNAITDLETATERDVDKIIERTAQLHAKRETVMLKKHIYLDGHMTDLGEFEKDLEAFDGKNEPSGAGANGDAYAGTRDKS